MAAHALVEPVQFGLVGLADEHIEPPEGEIAALLRAQLVVDPRLVTAHVGCPV
jgi:hypothetical protein